MTDTDTSSPGNGKTIAEHLTERAAADGSGQASLALAMAARNVFPIDPTQNNRIAIVYEDGSCAWLADGHAEPVALAEGMRRAGSLSRRNVAMLMKSNAREVRVAAIAVLAELDG